MNTLKVTFTYQTLRPDLTFGEVHRLVRESTVERINSFLYTRNRVLEADRAPVVWHIDDRKIADVIQNNSQLWVEKRSAMFSVAVEGAEGFDWDNGGRFDPNDLLVIVRVGHQQ